MYVYSEIADLIEGVPNRGHLSNRDTSSGPNSIEACT